MTRYCPTCEAHVNVTLDDRRENEVCATCGALDVRFTLCQHLWFRDYFTDQTCTSVQVRKCMFTRSGMVGIVVDVWQHGLGLDFGGSLPSIEAWNWDELDIAHLLSDEDAPSYRQPQFDLFRLMDTVMLKNGDVCILHRYVKTRDQSIRYGVSGVTATVRNSKGISRESVHKVVDWLPNKERLGVLHDSKTRKTMPAPERT